MLQQLGAVSPAIFNEPMSNAAFMSSSESCFYDFGARKYEVISVQVVLVGNKENAFLCVFL